MNYLIDVDNCLLCENEGMNRDLYFRFCEWSKNHTYYLISNLTFDELYAAIGKSILYNAEAIYANGGRTVYIQGRMVEHDDVIANDITQLLNVLPLPLTYAGNNRSIQDTVLESYSSKSSEDFSQILGELSEN